MTEVSIRWPCQVIATSPGRSASQAAPSASKPDQHEEEDDADHRRPRLKARSPSAASASAANCRLAASAALRACALRDPGLRRRARRGRELRQLGERARKIGPGGAPRHARGRRRVGIIAGRFVGRPDAHELSGIALQAFEEGAVARRGARGPDDRRRNAGEFLRQRPRRSARRTPRRFPAAQAPSDRARATWRQLAQRRTARRARPRSSAGRPRWRGAQNGRAFRRWRLSSSACSAFVLASSAATRLAERDPARRLRPARRRRAPISVRPPQRRRLPRACAHRGRPSRCRRCAAPPRRSARRVISVAFERRRSDLRAPGRWPARAVRRWSAPSVRPVRRAPRPVAASAVSGAWRAASSLDFLLGRR